MDGAGARLVSEKMLGPARASPVILIRMCPDAVTTQEETSNQHEWTPMEQGQSESWPGRGHSPRSDALAVR